MQLRWRFWLVLAAICSLGAQCALAANSRPIRRAVSLPETTPWNLEELSDPPEFEWAEGKNVRSLYYRSEPYKRKTTRVFAYYTTPGTLAGDPTQDRNLPGIVLAHGGSGSTFSAWAELWASRGYAAIAMDLCGYGPDRKRLTDGGPSGSHADRFGTIDQPITSQWSYHGVANVIRAHSLLLSFPEVDPKRTAVTGISWGGYLTCIVAGLDNRFKAAVPVYGCGFLHENSAWLDEFKKMSHGSQAQWVQLWDPSQYLGSATMPMLFVNGGKDFCYRTDSYAKTYGLVKTRTKNIRFSPSLLHGHIFDRPREIEIFIKHHLNGGTPLAKITSLEIGAQNVTASVETTKQLVSAQLYYTTDSHIGITSYDKSKGGRDWEASRTWTQQPASLDRNVIIAKRPPRA